MKYRVLVGMLMASAVMAGCSSVSNYSQKIQGIFTSKHIPDTPLYVRGSMSFWDAAPEYRLQRTAENVLSIDLNLFADGDSYEFKVADNDWSDVFNCGSQYTSQLVQPNVKTPLFCSTSSHNLSFKPEKSGVYRVTLVFKDRDDIELSISQAQ